MLKEDCLAVYEVWSSRVFKGLDDSLALTEMKETDDFAVSQLEFPWAEADEDAKRKAGAIYTVPAATGEVSSGGVAAAEGGELKLAGGRGYDGCQGSSGFVKASAVMW